MRQKFNFREWLLGGDAAIMPIETDSLPGWTAATAKAAIKPYRI
jgi:hypothetical protein